MFNISKQWHEILKPELESEKFKNFFEWLKNEYETKNIFPEFNNIFNALNLVLPQDVKVVLIGQDPYHQFGQAHGLSFSVQNGVKIPPSLRNIFVELKNDLGILECKNGNLTKWANQGVLLLNSVLTVEESLPNSHKGLGWEIVTNKIINHINQNNDGVVFLLWGANAKKFLPLINTNRHVVLMANHPSPMSANRGGWFGCKHFSKTNQALKKMGHSEIDWDLN